jgi:hypothetical protein
MVVRSAKKPALLDQPAHLATGITDLGTCFPNVKSTIPMSWSGRETLAGQRHCSHA